MNDNEKKNYIMAVFGLAAAKGMCRTKRDFAGLLGVNDKSLSSAMNAGGKALTDSLILKVKSFAALNGLEPEAAPVQPAAAPAIHATELEMLRDLISTNKSQQDTISNLTRLLLEARTGAPLSAAQLAALQKKSPADKAGE